MLGLLWCVKMSKRLATFTDSLSSFPLVMEGNGGWIKPLGLPTPNGSAVFIDCANERKKERGTDEKKNKSDILGRTARRYG